MKVFAVHTDKITAKDKNLFEFLDKYIPILKEKSIVTITSKVIAILEGNIIPKDKINKDKLVMKESDLVAPGNYYKTIGFRLTIKNSLIIPSAGIDESNAFDHYILWPKDPYYSAKIIWEYLKKKNKINYLGIIITDSKTTPLRWGTTGASIGHCGFEALKNYINSPDIFGKKMRVTKANLVDGLAATAVLMMGEGNEQTPIAIIEDLGENITFKKSSTSKKEINDLGIKLKDDIYYPILSKVKWIQPQPPAQAKKKGF